MPDDCEPDVPVQPPGDTEQLVAFVLDHEMVAEVLCAILQDAAPLQRMEAVGAGGAPTFAVIVLFVLPPGPVQVRVYIWPVVSGPRDSEPDGTAFPPDQFPLAVQVATFVVVHARFAVPLYGTEQEPVLPLHVKFSVGGGDATFTVTISLAEPPGPVQFTV